MEHFNRTPRTFRYKFSKLLNKPEIHKTASLAGLPVFIGKVSIGKYTYLNGDAFLEHVSIGNYCSIGRDLSIISGTHDMNAFSTFSFSSYNHKTPFLKYKLPDCGSDIPAKQTIIDNDVWIGSYTKIIGGVHINTGAVIGAGSIVTKDVPPYAIVAGCPAKIIRYRFSEEKIEKLLKSEWWNYSETELIENFSSFQNI